MYMNTLFILTSIFLLHSYASSFHRFSSPKCSQTVLYNIRKYPLSRYGKEHYLRQLNSRNISEREEAMFAESNYDSTVDEIDDFLQNFNGSHQNTTIGGIRIIIGNGANLFNFDQENDDDDGDTFEKYSKRKKGHTDKKSENFEVITKSPVNFADVGGYDSVKLELGQCVDLLKNHTKYAGYNIRVPRGLIFEGPPGNGKTLLAKALAGEARTGFIAVSGSEFQEKYVGVGSARIRELFALAKKNVPCIVFIDEIDALGRKRSGDGEASSSERDSTLNELLVAMDGFKNATGIFVIGATNRADLLDPALTRPGRIDKRVYIGNPDAKTRKAILQIHLKGKPHDKTVILDNLVEITNGLSAAQIENLVNEAMLNALKLNRNKFTSEDIDSIVNRIMVGWQPNEHQFTANIIDHIAVHEMGHAVVGLLSKHHSKMTKVIINLQAPQSPAYTVFEASNSPIYTREALFEHLMILLAGRIAEEVFYDVSVTTGAINDFEEALKLAQKMVVYYGMGKNVIYPNMSEKYKEMIDEEVAKIIHDAYGYSEFVLRNSKDFIHEGAELLKRDKVVNAETLLQLINTKYKSVLSLKYNGKR